MIQKIEQFFKEITGFTPYNFQIEAMHSILDGKSIILRAPTGSGKSETCLIPFLYLTYQNLVGKKFPSQMIYSLPIRVLVENLGKRFKNFCEKKFKNLKIAIHHGENPESELFLENIIVSTIDQTVGAYCCVPLSMSLRSGNISAGSVSSSFLVFDEVHVYDPEFALQAVLILLEHSNALKIPFAILSATLPDSFLKFFKKNFKNLKIVDVKNENEIISRKLRKIFLRFEFNQPLNSYLLKNRLPKNKKIIIVCNTVKRAQDTYLTLLRKYRNIFLVHSQFTPQDRKKKEEKIEKIFGKNSQHQTGVLITTQVIEVGMDISCDLMITELAPIDSLIQRAGRIARWGGKGEMLILGLNKNEKNPYAPYEKEICVQTESTLKKMENKKHIKLDWKLEKELVNKILSKKFEEYLNPERKGGILTLLAQAAFEGDKNLAEVAVRGPELTCQVAIHKNPQKLGNQALYLPRINISYFKLNKFFQNIVQKQKGNLNFIWEVSEENIIKGRFIDEETTTLSFVPVQEIKPYKFYIISSNFVKYSPEIGLILEKGESKDFKPKNSKDFVKNVEFFTFKKELWVEHSIKTLKIFEEEILPQNEFIFKKLALAWKIPKEKMIKYLKLAILLHDIGKLNKSWQKKIYEIEEEKWNSPNGSPKPPLAHSSKKHFVGIPHAPISAEILKKYLEKLDLLEEIKRALCYSVAHHHAPRSYEANYYEFIPEWKDILTEVAAEANLQIDLNLIKSEGSVRLSKFPSIRDGLYYRSYAIFAKVLRLADRKACEEFSHL